MKKLIFSLIATAMFSFISFANEIGEIKDTEVICSVTNITDQEDEETLRICYLMSIEVSEPVPGIIKTVKNYICFNHSGVLGDGTVYIGN